jgi:hypothetical protein
MLRARGVLDVSASQSDGEQEAGYIRGDKLGTGTGTGTLLTLGLLV